ALSRLVVLAFVASAVFFWVPGAGTAFAAPPVGTIQEFAAATGVSASASSPVGITAGPANTLLFADAPNSRVGRINTDGTGVTAFPAGTTNGAPVAIVAGPKSHIWFTEQSVGGSTGGRIGEMTTAGAIVTETQVNPVTTTVGIDGLAVGPDGFLWFTEQSKAIVAKMDPTTYGVTEYTITGTAQPTAITAGPDGNMYFVDVGNNAIGKITTSGT